jgi:hypothetical protein
MRCGGRGWCRPAPGPAVRPAAPLDGAVFMRLAQPVPQQVDCPGAAEGLQRLDGGRLAGGPQVLQRPLRPAALGLGRMPGRACKGFAELGKLLQHGQQHMADAVAGVRPVGVGRVFSTHAACVVDQPAADGSRGTASKRAVVVHAMTRSNAAGMAARPGRPAPRLSASNTVSTWSSACWASSHLLRALALRLRASASAR